MSEICNWGFDQCGSVLRVRCQKPRNEGLGIINQLMRRRLRDEVEQSPVSRVSEKLGQSVVDSGSEYEDVSLDEYLDSLTPTRKENEKVGRGCRKKVPLRSRRDKLAMNLMNLERIKLIIQKKIKEYTTNQNQEISRIPLEQPTPINLLTIQQDSIPVLADVRTLDFHKIIERQIESGKKLFDAILMEPPWNTAIQTPGQETAIKDNCLTDAEISELPIQRLSKNGYLFLWVTNSKYSIAQRMIKGWGYQYVDEITWIKLTSDSEVAKGHGKEICLVGYKGDPRKIKLDIPSVIMSERRKSSQKPQEIYQAIESLSSHGSYLQMFGKTHPLRDRWVTIANQPSN